MNASDSTGQAGLTDQAVWLDELFLSPAARPAAIEQLREYGFRDLARADRLLQELAGEPPVRQMFVRIAPALLEHLANSAAPEMALNNLVRLVRGWGQPRTLYELWEAAPWSLEWLVNLMALSQVFADILVREPGTFELLVDTARLQQERTLGMIAAELRYNVATFQTLEHQWNAIRRFKRREFLRIGARDWLRLAPLPVALRELSNLAEACCVVALEVCRAALEQEWGVPVREEGGPAAFAIIGMGKLGAGELNYNSDIDLMFVFEGEGYTRPPAAGRKPLPNREFFERLARLVMDALGAMTAEGRVFRVDARLRPEGESGPLVRSLNSYLNYYEAWAEPWEMQALIKARAVAGDDLLRQRFDALAREVAFRRQLDADAIQSIRRNKQRLEERAVQRGRAARQVKQGYGGIRDIEFTVQLLQLVGGVEHPALRVANTLEALQALSEEGILSEEERETLEQGYLFLRRVEHLLQIQSEVPQQALPDDPQEAERLARRMGYRPRGTLSAADRFRQAYEAYTAGTRRLCEQLFFHPIPPGEVPLPLDTQRLLDPLLPHQEAAESLHPYGFQQPEEARRRIIFLAYGEPPMRLPERVQRVFARLLPILLERIGRAADPDLAIRHFERFVTALGGREMLYQFLLDQPEIAELLLLIGGASESLSQTLRQHPEYLDQITDAATITQVKDAATFTAEIRERLRGHRSLSERLEDLRRYRRREFFRIGVRELQGGTSAMAAMQELSDLADACTREVMELLQRDQGLTLPFALLALGKWGSRELHYSSDLDVLFVYQGEHEVATEAEAWAALQLAETLIRVMGTQKGGERLFEMDARLRPDGRNGPLVKTLQGYLNYYHQRGEVWERLALTRLRWVAGDEELGEQFLRQIAEWVYAAPPTEEEMAQIRHIRARVAKEKGPPANVLDVKLSPGGIFDIEFLVQILLIQHGSRADVRRASVSAALQALRHADVLSQEEAEILVPAYQMLRELELKLQLVTERSSARLSTEQEWAQAARRLGYGEEVAAFRQHYLAHMEKVRRVYQERVGVEEA